MNNKGFISTTIVYSFFLVFLLILLYIVSDLVNNRILINALDDEIKNEISDDNFGRYLTINADDLGLVKHDSTLPNGSLDNSLRYVGSNPNNYICFGSEVSPCPSENLYRIIGVFNNQLKIIKNTAYGSNRNFDSLNSNYYVSSDMHEYLNTVFLNSILSPWNELIATHVWYVGGIDNTFTNSNVYDIYTYELGSEKKASVYINAKIGLMHISDYGYAASTNYYASNITGAANWLNNNQSTWFMTRNSSSNDTQYYLTNTGTINIVSVSSSNQVRPTFYLNSSVKIAGGTGTSSDPYRIEV